MTNNESCAAACGADEALFASILADVPPDDPIPAPVPMAFEQIKQARKLAVAGASLWCAYTLTKREDDEKFGKVPLHRDTLRLMGANNPEWFYPFNEAIAIHQASNTHGIGTLLAGAPDIVGIDIDTCIDEGGELAGWAAAIVDRFDTYTEVSVSGTGLHLFMHATKPPGCGTRVGGVEVYGVSDTRFLTVSGRIWRDDLCEIKARQSELTGWVAEVLADTGGESSRMGGGMGAAGCVDRAGADAANDACEGAEGLGLDAAGADRISLRENEEIARLVLATNNAGGKLQRMIRGNMTTVDEAPYLNADGSVDQSRVDQAILFRIAWFTHSAVQCAEVFEDIAPVRVESLKYRKPDRWRKWLEYSAGRAIAERLPYPTYDENVAESKRKKEQGAQRQASFAGLLAGGMGRIEINRSGKAQTSLLNLQEIIGRAHVLVGVFAYDEFSDSVVKQTQLPPEIMPPVRLKGSMAHGGPMPINDDDLCGLMLWIARNFGADYQLKFVQAAINNVARQRQINLVAGVLDALEWDGVCRLDSWLVDYLHADTRSDHADYVAAVGRKFMIQAVARAFVPGCKADAVLILEGEQGARKSSAVRVLGTAIAPHTFRENLPDLKGADSRELQMALRGAWFAELQELKALRSASAVEHIKAVVTTAEDNYRAPYEIFPRVIVRTSVFIGTVNPDGAGYLNDPTGGRRYWPVAVSTIDVEGLAAIAPQLFAEAVAAYKSGELWYWSAEDYLGKWATDAIARRMPADAWEDVLIDKLPQWAGGHLSLSEVWTQALGFGNASECDGPRAGRLGRVLRQIGCRQGERNKLRVWLIPEDIGK